ncbi:MAG: protein-export chaperone SecB [Pseudomonadota bacterium]
MAKTPKKTDADKDVDENSLNISVDGDAPAAPEAPAQGEQATAEPQQANPMLNVLAQYIRDMSFENPNAPDSLRSGQAQPEMNIDLRIGRQVNQDNTIEISLLIKAHATRGDQTVFLAELDYAGLFAIQNVDMEQIQPLMMIECPRLLFPYARKILADMTQDGGHMPVMLDMPDFASMFREEMMRRAQEQGLN